MTWLKTWKIGKRAKVKPKPPSSVRPGGNLQKDLPSIPISPGGYVKTKPTQQYEKGGSVAVPILPRKHATPLDTKRRTQCAEAGADGARVDGRARSPVKDVPLRGYLNGGSVKHGSTTQAGWKRRQVMADKIARNLDPTGGVQWPSDTERRSRA